MILPVFVFAVLAALTLALRWSAPKLGETSTVVATALVIVVCGTLVAVAALVASAAYDYHLESAELQVMQGMSSMHGHCDANCLAHEDRDRRSRCKSAECSWSAAGSCSPTSCSWLGSWRSWAVG